MTRSAPSDAAKHSAAGGGDRLFLALRPPAPVRAAWAAYIAGVRPAALSFGRWTATDDLHLTLRFLGRASAERVRGLRRGAAAIAARQTPFDLTFSGWALWPEPRRARLLVWALRSSAPLQALADTLEDAALAAGYGAVSRPFRAHVTVARLRPGEGPALDLTAPFPADSWRADALQLLRSATGAARPRYTVAARWPLRGAAPGGEEAGA